MTDWHVTRCLHFTSRCTQPVAWTMRMSPAKRRLGCPASTFMTSLRHSKAAVWTVDDVARLIIEWIFKTFLPDSCIAGCVVYTHFISAQTAGSFCAAFSLIIMYYGMLISKKTKIPSVIAYYSRFTLMPAANNVVSDLRVSNCCIKVDICPSPVMNTDWWVFLECTYGAAVVLRRRGK